MGGYDFSPKSSFQTITEPLPNLKLFFLYMVGVVPLALFADHSDSPMAPIYVILGLIRPGDMSKLIFGPIHLVSRPDKSLSYLAVLQIGYRCWRIEAEGVQRTKPRIRRLQG